MTNTKRKLRKRKDVLLDLERLDKKASKLLFIHYSCEDFYSVKDSGRSARITSIAVREFDTGQSISFSIHTTAEKEKKLANIEDRYDELEKTMLKDFYSFVKSHEDYHWIHWNMRDTGYGFSAINHRYSVLGGKPTLISDDKKFDLADKLKIIYGDNYIEHPRFEQLINKNSISKKDFLNGTAEAKAFEEKDYIKLHYSTLRKVNILHDIFENVLDKSLITNAKKKDIYGLSPQGLFEMWNGHWLFNIVLLFLGGIASWIVNWVIE